MKQVCEKCKKQTDKVKRVLLVGDEKFLNPGTQPYSWKCKNCGHLLDSNDKIFILEDED